MGEFVIYIANCRVAHDMACQEVIPSFLTNYILNGTYGFKIGDQIPAVEDNQYGNRGEQHN